MIRAERGAVERLRWSAHPDTKQHYQVLKDDHQVPVLQIDYENKLERICGDCGQEVRKAVQIERLLGLEVIWDNETEGGVNLVLK